jgi:tetratricopeptide (TPR) repeat protein
VKSAARALAVFGWPRSHGDLADAARGQALTWAALNATVSAERKKICGAVLEQLKNERGDEARVLRGAAQYWLLRDAAARREFSRARGAAARRWLAQVELRQGNPAGALKLSDEKTAWGLALRAEALLKLGRNEEAAGEAGRAMKLDKKFAWVYVIRSEAHRALRRFDAALADLDALVKAAPGPWALALRARTNFNFGDKKKALKDLDRALKIEPGFAEAWAFRGEGLRRLGRYGEALKNLDKAVRLAPELGRARAWRGATLRRLGRFKEAVAELSVNLKENAADNEFSWALSERAKARLFAGDWTGAFRDMNEASFLDAKQGFLDAHDKDSSVVLARLKRAPRSAWASAWLGEALLRLGRFDEALEALTAAGRRGRSLCWRALALRKLGRLSEASADLDLGLKLEPGFSAAYGWRAELSMAAGDYQRALRDLDRLLKRDDRTAWAFAWRGQCLLRLGRNWRAAANDLETAVNLDARYADAWAWLAEARRRGGLLKKAEAASRNSLNLKGDRALAYLVSSLIHGDAGRPRRQVRDFASARAHGLAAPDGRLPAGRVQ